MKVSGLLLLAVVTSGAIPAFATAGLAEWEIKTPGGHFISHADPYIQRHGTCLRGAQPEAVYVSHVEWWRGYRGAVAGKARRGYFIFSETTRAAAFFDTAEELRRAIVARRLGEATSPRMNPEDGWRQVWGPVLLERCRQLEAPSSGVASQGLDAATQASIRKTCAEIRASAARR